MENRTVADIKDEAISLGLSSPQEIVQYVQQAQSQERAERAERRQLEQKEREDIRRAEIEGMRMKQAEADREAKIQQLSTEAQLAAAKHELDLARQELSHKQALELRAAGPDVPLAAPKLTLRPFPSDPDQVEAYFSYFEETAVDYKWDDKTKLRYLVPHLQDKGQDIYFRLKNDDQLTYEELKSALTDAFGLNLEESRGKFTAALLEEGETCKIFVSRLRHHFRTWHRLSQLSDTKEGIIEMIIVNQLLASLPKSLRAYLRTNKVVGLKETAEKADAWFEVYGYHARVKNEAILKGNFNKTSKVADKERLPNSFRQFNNPRSFYPARQTSAAVASEPSNEEDVIINSAAAHMLCCAATSTASAPKVKLPTCEGYIQGRKTMVMRDTGSTGCVVKLVYVQEQDYTGRHLLLRMIDGSEIRVPEARVTCHSPYFTGSVTAAVLAQPVCDFIIGNIPGATTFPGRHACTQTEDASMTSAAVTTRAAARAPPRKPFLTTVPSLEKLLRSDIVLAQQKSDPTLAKLREYANSKYIRNNKGISTEFIWDKDRLYRKTIYTTGEEKLQFVVPADYREEVFRLGHSSILGGHLGSNKTLSRIQAVLFWPGMGVQVARLARSCDICQRTTDKGRTSAAPLQPLPVIEEPFSRVAVDIVGPIRPCAADKSLYILTIVDFATRWPEAVALKNVEATTVAEAMFQVFCRVGIPREVLSDRGSQFTSSLMAEVLKLLAIKGMHTTPYHPL